MSEPATPPRKQLLENLNAHGDPLAAAVNLASNRIGGPCGFWNFRAAEFAGELRNTVAHIDGVAECQVTESQRVLLAAFESKRVSPLFSAWCFMRDSVMRGTATARRPIADVYRYTPPMSEEEGDGFWAEAVSLDTESPTYSRAYSVKTKDLCPHCGKADGRDKGRAAINEAVTQACRGSGILVNVVRGWNLPTAGVLVFPVVVTTADLWVSKTELSEASLSTGNLEKELDLQGVPWLWFETHLSPDLAPETNRRYTRGFDTSDRIGHLLDHHQARAVMITKATHLQEALSEIACASSTVHTLN